MTKIYISKIGIISAIGDDTKENLAALKRGQHGLSFPSVLQTKHKDFLVGEVKKTNAELQESLQLPSVPLANRSAYLGIWAMNELLEGLPLDLISDPRTGFINATSVGSMAETEQQFLPMLEMTDISDRFHAENQLDCASCTKDIAKYFGLRGYQSTISTACSSAANAIQLGARLIKQGVCDRVICGGTDSLSLFTLNGFYSLKNVDKRASVPFDDQRNGLNLGEGAAYILLESEHSLQSRSGKALAMLSGYANTNEAHHPTAPSPEGEGAANTMQQALHSAGLAAKDIDYLNAHGTATLGNDLSESRAIKTVFGDALPKFSSTKSFTGHTLAAAGAVEAVFSILAITENLVPANLRFHTPMMETGFTPVTETQLHKKNKHVMSNSFGFGGSNVSLIFSAKDEA